MGARKELSFLGRAVFENVNDLFDRAFANASESIRVKIEVPEGFVHMPKTQLGRVKTSQISGISSDILNKAASFLLPAGLVFLGNFLGANAVVLTILAGVGGVVSTFIGKTSSETSSDSSENFQPENLKPEDVKAKVSMDEDKKEKFLAIARQEIEKLSEEISDFENAANARHDIAKDRKFGDWVQRFLIFADKHSEDRAIQKLRDNLVEVLATMRIYVYDNVKLQEEGTPDVYRDDYFREDYLIDNRTGKTYTRVSRPAVYSNETFLARGEIS